MNIKHFAPIIRISYRFNRRVNFFFRNVSNENLNLGKVHKFPCFSVKHVFHKTLNKILSIAI